ncbi:MAG: hypothetical protein FWE10_04745 [Rikenellaceae bacterium]|nr:hypothetical protein [Rikenellaceae bacterium]MCL2691908.1 hypothetical protein [Rikenellaceae bacterium]
MKSCYLFVLSAFLLVVGCYSEPAIIPSNVGGAADKFDFPQGMSPADAIFVDIYERFGVKVIYKDFTQLDIDRAWTSSSGGTVSPYQWNFITDEQQLLEAATVIDQKVLSLLPQDIVRASLIPYPYMYLTNNLRRNIGAGQVTHYAVYPTKALDGMTVNFHVTGASDDFRRVSFPALVLLDIFINAVHEGMVTMPDAWFGNVVRDGDVRSYNFVMANPDRYEWFWGRQGHIPLVSLITGRISTSKETSFSSKSVASGTSVQPLNRSNYEMAFFFIYLCLDQNWRWLFEPGNLLHDSPRSRERLEQFNDHMRDVYGIDFDVIRAKLYEGSTVDTSPERFLNNLNPQPNPEIYIYNLI